MGRQSKASKQESFGKGKVTPVQVAFMVDRYLSDNNYTKTLSVFRTEASNLLTRTRGGQAPKGLLSLGAILDEYICLKEQKLMVDNERNRVERLLQGMQAAMNAYNSAGSVSPAATTPSPPMGLRNGSHEDQPIYNNHTANTVRMLPSNTSDCTHSSTRIVSHPSMNKRKASRPVSDVSPAVKKSSAVLPMNSLAAAATKILSQGANSNSTNEVVRELSHIQSSSPNNPQNGNSVQGSCVARNLFDKPPEPKTISPCPKTPPRPLPSQVDQSISPSDSSTLCDSFSRDTPGIIPTNCHVISSKTVILSPCKHIRISSSPLKLTPRGSNKRDQVKGRLDFNDSDTPMCQESPVAEEISSPGIDNETMDIFGADVPDFDFFGTDISLSELLDIDLSSAEMGLPFQQALEPSLDFITGQTNELGYGGIEANRDSFEPSLSGVNKFLSENGICSQDSEFKEHGSRCPDNFLKFLARRIPLRNICNQTGPESIISVKSITKCIQIVSPAKKRMNSSSDRTDKTVTHLHHVYS